MRDIKSRRLIIIKGFLFVLLGSLAGLLLLWEQFSLKNLTLLLLTIWAFCRFYYFAFYVIEHYVDPSFRFSGLFDALRYLLKGRPSSFSARATHHHEQESDSESH